MRSFVVGIGLSYNLLKSVHRSESYELLTKQIETSFINSVGCFYFFMSVIDFKMLYLEHYTEP